MSDNDKAILDSEVEQERLQKRFSELSERLKHVEAALAPAVGKVRRYSLRSDAVEVALSQEDMEQRHRARRSSLVARVGRSAIVAKMVKDPAVAVLYSKYGDWLAEECAKELSADRTEAGLLERSLDALAIDSGKFTEEEVKLIQKNTEVRMLQASDPGIEDRAYAHMFDVLGLELP